MRASAAFTVALASAAASVVTAATVCNGYAELCTKLYSNVTVVGAHNSYANSSTNLAASQDYDVVQQLTDGVRLLQNQVHNQNGTLRLCHTSCLLYDGGTLEDYLTKVKTWMDANPTEVVSLLLVNIDDQPPTDYSAIYTAVGVDKLSWTPPQAIIPTGSWPTYGALIDAGTRLVTFMDTLASFTSVPYIIDEFTNMWEDPYDAENQTFPCTVDRHNGSTTGQMYLINHYLYTTTTMFGGTTPEPNKALLNVTNAVSGYGSLGEETETCAALHDMYPTFLLVDFYDYGGGSVFEVAANLNGVQWNGKQIQVPASTGTASGSSSKSAARPIRVFEGLWGTLAVIVAAAFLGSCSDL